MTKATYIMVGLLFGLMIICVTILIAFGKEPDALVSLLVGTLIPTVAAIYAGNQSSKAKEAADQTVRNTNGNLNRLIDLLEAHGINTDVERPNDGHPNSD